MAESDISESCQGVGNKIHESGAAALTTYSLRIIDGHIFDGD